MKFRVAAAVLLLVAAGSFWSAGALPAEDKAPAKPADQQVSYGGKIKPILEEYCVNCHGGDRPRADLALDVFKDDADALAQKKVWEKVAHVLRTREMPPRGKPQPTQADFDAVVQWIDYGVFRVDCGGAHDPGRVTLRRLNKAEYNNTVRDLLGVDFRPADDFPSDDVGYGFDNIGDVLSLSPLLVEKYLEAAEEVVEAAWQKPELRQRVLVRQPRDDGDLETARQLIENFAARAYRRPARPEDVDRLMQFVALARKSGDSLENGIKLAVKAMLASPHFLFRVEEDRPAQPGQKGAPVSEFELASRLSYFLWSSMPDGELFELAGKGELRQNLEGQVRRMLAHPKSQALVKNFAGQWLQLRNLAQKKVNPDPDRFPTFDEKLRAAMVRETELFFEEVLRQDRSVYEFLDADYTFVNERLARHYGLPGVTGEEFRKVRLPDDRRGGVLTHASILTVTSNPTRTSPVVRGKWVLENILNAPPPPPAPDVPPLADDQKAAETASLRKRLELHRANPSCAACHQRMDPIGFGLENFNAVGQWRDQDGKFPIDASGALPGGEAFNGPKQLRQVLVQARGEDFRRCLVEKMLTYALGRGLEYYDRCAVQEIMQAMSRDENKFSSLVVAVTKSTPFQMRRGQ